MRSRIELHVWETILYVCQEYIVHAIAQTLTTYIYIFNHITMLCLPFFCKKKILNRHFHSRCCSEHWYRVRGFGDVHVLFAIVATNMGPS